MYKSAIIKKKDTGKIRVVRMESIDLDVEQLKRRKTTLEEQIKAYQYHIQYYQSLLEMVENELKQVNEVLEKEND